MKRLFPFSLNEYLKVFACFMVFIAVFLMASYFSSAFFQSKLAGITSETAKLDALATLAVLVSYVALAFLLFTFVLKLIYSIAAKKKLNIKLWPKYMLSSLMIALIFLIPFMFFLRLSADQSPAAIWVFITIFVIALHFSNLVYFFTAVTGKTFEGIRKGFYFGTVKIRNLLISYFFVLIAYLILSIIGWISKVDFVNVLLSVVFFSWAALYVNRTAIKIQKH